MMLWAYRRQPGDSFAQPRGVRLCSTWEACWCLLTFKRRRQNMQLSRLTQGRCIMLLWTLRLAKIGLLIAAWVFLGWVVAAAAMVFLLAAALPRIDTHEFD